MKRLFITGLLLLSTIALCFFEIFSISNVSNIMDDNLEKINSLVSSGNISEAKKISLQSYELWEEKMKLLAIFIQHDSLEDIEESLTLMNTFLENEEISDFLCENQKARVRLSNLKDTEYPNIENIL